MADLPTGLARVIVASTVKVVTVAHPRIANPEVIGRTMHQRPSPVLLRCWGHETPVNHRAPVIDYPETRQQKIEQNQRTFHRSGCAIDAAGMLGIFAGTSIFHTGTSIFHAGSAEMEVQDFSRARWQKKYE